MAMDLEDKVILITGGTGGIGKAAAAQLARRGATLVLVGRDPEKGARAAGELSSTTGNDRVEHLQADLSRMSDVRRVAAEFRARHRRLDVLVNNAGAIFADWRHPGRSGGEHLRNRALDGEAGSRLHREAGRTGRVRCLLRLQAREDAAKHNGEYFSDRRIARTSKLARDPALAERLWRFTEKLCAEPSAPISLA
jgi:short chain dehydrogenase